MKKVATMALTGFGSSWTFGMHQLQTNGRFTAEQIPRLPISATKQIFI